MFQAIAAGYSQDRDTVGKAVIESAFEEFRKRRQLLHPGRTHVAFIVGQWYGKPGI
jgi:hypothetical protein